MFSQGCIKEPLASGLQPFQAPSHPNCITNELVVSRRPEEKIKILEKKVNDLIEESCMAHSMGALQLV